MNSISGVRIICIGPKEGFAGIRRVLDDHGAEVRVVKTLPEFEKFEKLSLPDLVFVWLVRDTRNLLKVLPLLKKEHKRVPVIVVTDRTNLDLYLNALTLGAFDALGLPVDEVELLRITRRELVECSGHTASATA